MIISTAGRKPTIKHPSVSHNFTRYGPCSGLLPWRWGMMSLITLLLISGMKLSKQLSSLVTCSAANHHSWWHVSQATIKPSHIGTYNCLCPLVSGRPDRNTPCGITMLPSCAEHCFQFQEVLPYL